MNTASVRTGSAAWPNALAIGGYICLCLVYLIWGWSDDISDFGGDSSMYMLIARNFSPFYANSPVLSQAIQGTVYPPLFPFVIGLLGGSMLAGHLLVVVSLLATVLLLYAWLRLEQFGLLVSAWIAAVFALMPGTYFLALNIWSENLYLAFSLAALVAENRASSEGNRRPGLLWGAAAAVAGATLIRSAALPLLAAFVIRLIIVRPRRWPWLIAASAAPFLIWATWSKLHQSGLSGYMAQWSSVYGGSAFPAFAMQAEVESRRIFMAWMRAWLGQAGAGTSLAFLVSVLGCVCLLGWLRSLAKLRFDALYVALYAALLLLWPFAGEAQRLSYVIIPVLLVQAALFIRSLFRPQAGDKGRNLALATWLGAMTLLILPSLFLTAHKFNIPVPAPLAVVKHFEDWYIDDRLQASPSSLFLASNLNNLRSIGKYVPPGDCVFAIKPSVVTLYSGRASYVPPPESSSEEVFGRGMAQCRYVYGTASMSTSFHEPFYPLGRLQGRTQVLATAEGGDSLHWDTYGVLIRIQPEP